MHEIQGSTAVNGHFVDGTSTQSGTVVTANWLNTVQDEICNLITSVGIQLNPAESDDKKQLIAAINKIVSNESVKISDRINANKKEMKDAWDRITWCEQKIKEILSIKVTQI